MPTLALLVVSWTPGGEYDKKVEIYANLGVLYYVIYNPDYWQRDLHQPLEIYRLVNGSYQLQIGEPFWMPEIGLGIGRYVYTSGQVQRQLLCWYDQKGQRLQLPEELLVQEQQRTEQERLRAERAEQVQRAAIAQLLTMGLSREQVAETLGLSIQFVNQAAPE